MSAGRKAVLAVVLLVVLLTITPAIGDGPEHSTGDPSVDSTSPAVHLTLVTGGVVAVLCALIVAWSVRSERQSWSADLRAAMLGQVATPEAQGLIAEFRRYLETLADGAPGAASAQPWTARRLRRALRERLAGEGVLAYHPPALSGSESAGGSRQEPPAAGERHVPRRSP